MRPSPRPSGKPPRPAPVARFPQPALRPRRGQATKCKKGAPRLDWAPRQEGLFGPPWSALFAIGNTPSAPADHGEAGDESGLGVKEGWSNERCTNSPLFRWQGRRGQEHPRGRVCTESFREASGGENPAALLGFDEVPFGSLAEEARGQACQGGRWQGHRRLVRGRTRSRRSGGVFSDEVPTGFRAGGDQGSAFVRGGVAQAGRAAT